VPVLLVLCGVPCAAAPLLAIWGGEQRWYGARVGKFCARRGVGRAQAAHRSSWAPQSRGRPSPGRPVRRGCIGTLKEDRTPPNADASRGVRGVMGG